MYLYSLLNTKEKLSFFDGLRAVVLQSADKVQRAFLGDRKNTTPFSFFFFKKRNLQKTFTLFACNSSTRPRMIKAQAHLYMTCDDGNNESSFQPLKFVYDRAHYGMACCDKFEKPNSIGGNLSGVGRFQDSSISPRSYLPFWYLFLLFVLLDTRWDRTFCGERFCLATRSKLTCTKVSKAFGRLSFESVLTLDSMDVENQKLLVYLMLMDEKGNISLTLTGWRDPLPLSSLAKTFMGKQKRILRTLLSYPHNGFSKAITLPSLP